MTAKTVCDSCNEFLPDDTYTQNWELRVAASGYRMYSSNVPEEVHLCADCAGQLLAPVFAKFTKEGK